MANIVIKTSRSMNNQEIANLLRSISAAYEVKGEDKFRISAYERAAAAVEHSSSEVKDLWDEHQLENIPGVGPNIASHLDELFRTGKVKHFESVVKNLPRAMFELLAVPGVGAKTAYKLCQAFKLKNHKKVINDLIKIARNNQIATLEGFGEKSQSELLESLILFKQGQIKKKRMVLPYADSIARQIIEYLKKNPNVLRADSLGSLRRRVSTVGDIDISVATRKPKEVVEMFIQYPQIKKVIEKGSVKASAVLRSGHQVDLRVQKPEAYGAMLQYFIGSKQHNIHLRELALKKGYSLSEYGIKPIKKVRSLKHELGSYNKKLNLIEFADENKFYNFLGLPWIPPELREDTGEIEAALRQAQGKHLRQTSLDGIRDKEGKQNGLPELVELKDIKGDLHLHSNFPIEPGHDLGENTMMEVVKKAASLGYEYIAFSEHNPSYSSHSENEMLAIIEQKRKSIEQLKYSIKGKYDVQIFNSLEVDILPDGRLAVPDKGLQLLDFAIASIHSSFKMARQKMTQRVLQALAHPKVKIFGHPTGRKLNYREGYELNWQVIFEHCRKKRIALEINAYPDRLDLPDFLVREAIKNQVKIVINTDSHKIEQLDLMEYGVYVARRGWAQKNDVLNTFTYDKIMEILKGGEKN